MALGLAELGGQKCFDQIPGQFCPNDAAAQANDVHVVVFDALPRREMIFDQGRANACNLIGADRRADAAAADGHAAHHLPLGNRTGEGDHEIRIVILRIQREGAKIGDFMSRGAKLAGKLVL